MSPRDFELRYRADPDPWGYESSRYEREKYDATILACGPGPHDRGLELGSSIGVLSARLAQHCRSLITIDGAPTAVADARRRLSGIDHVQIVLGEIPAAIPPGRYDLIVASEILYYLEETALAATLERLSDQLAADGRLVAVHWRPAGAERPFTAAEVHDRLRETEWLSPLARADTANYLLDILEHR